jgi:antitoxin component YwqK of YwqJK toxin-antitoxin module
MEKNDERINQLDSEGRRHVLWESGPLWWRRHYHHGTLHGLWEEYRVNGTLWRRGHWHHGVMKGLDIRWGSQGRITDKAYHLVIR